MRDILISPCLRWVHDCVGQDQVTVRRILVNIWDMEMKLMHASIGPNFML